MACRTREVAQGTERNTGPHHQGVCVTMRLPPLTDGGLDVCLARPALGRARRWWKAIMQPPVSGHHPCRHGPLPRPHHQTHLFSCDSLQDTFRRLRFEVGWNKKTTHPAISPPFRDSLSACLVSCHLNPQQTLGSIAAPQNCLPYLTPPKPRATYLRQQPRQWLPHHRRHSKTSAVTGFR